MTDNVLSILKVFPRLFSKVGSKDGDVRVLRAELLSAQNKIKENTGEVNVLS